MITGSKKILTIIIPVYNRQRSLDLLLEKIYQGIFKNNNEKNIELVIVDDCSEKPVKLPDLFKPIALLVRNTINLGAPLSRKKGYQKSQGKFIHFHDSDDSISESWLYDIINELQENPNLDILMTGRVDHDKDGKTTRSQKYFHKQVSRPEKIKSRLVYRNCMGPLGGAVFSRRVLEQVKFKSFLSCQDWQMYIDAIEHAKVLRSRPDIHFIFDKTGDDRISHDARKKLLGHSQLAKITAPRSPFKKNIRLFYLYTCKQHIFNQGGLTLRFYKKNKFKIFFTYLLVSVYWRIT